MSWGAVVGAGASLIGGALGDRGGRQAARAQQQANERAAGQITAASDQARADVQPWANTGGWALGQQQQFLEGDWSGFENSPDYAWALDQGTKALGAGATANGNLWGGGADADRIALGQGMATQYAGNYYNRLQGLSGMGLGAAGTQAQVGMNAANSLAGLSQNTGQAQASAYANTANSWNNALGGVVGAFGQWQGNSGAGVNDKFKKPGGG